jgi:trk system potassium uptake protein TrkA
MRVIIVGAGEVGSYLARELSAQRMEIVLVDRLATALSSVEESTDVLTLRGDGAHWSVLGQAEVKRAELVVAVTGSDETNMVVAAIARAEGASRAVARVDAAGFYRSSASVERGVLGIDSLLCASRLVTDELWRLMRAQKAAFVDFFASNQMAACLLDVGDRSSALGHAASELRGAAGQLVRAVVRDGVLRLPEDVTRLEVGDRLLLVGEPIAVAVAHDQLEDSFRKRRTILVGGGDVGMLLARVLAGTERRVEIIERDAARCEELVQELDEVHVIHGDGTSIALLRDLQVMDADNMVAVTKSDEANLMVSLLGNNLGVGGSFAVIHRHGYADVYGHLGVHGTAGPHEVIARAIRSLLPNDGVLRRQKLPDCSHELMELSPSELAGGRPSVAELVLPPSCMLVGVVDDTGFHAPLPGLSLGAGSRLLVAAPSHAQRDVAKRVRELGRGRR